MDKPSSRPSGIPRLSRLPRPSAARENLRQQQPSSKTLHSHRLRSTPSRDQLSSSTSTRSRIIPTTSKGRDTANSSRRNPTDTTVHDPPSNSNTNGEAIFKKPQLRDQEGIRLGSRHEDDNDFVVEGLAETDQIPSKGPRKPRPSLSERTMETLQNIPASPAVRKRNSSFFNDSALRSPCYSGTLSRPGSSYQSDSSMRPPSRSVSSRPTSSGQGKAPDFRASTNTFKPPRSISKSQTPAKRPSTAKSSNTPSNFRSSIAGTPVTRSKVPSPKTSISNLQQRSPSPNKSAKAPIIKSGSSTVGARSAKPRASLNGLFRRPSIPTLDQSSETARIGFAPRKSSATVSSTSEVTSTSSKGSNGIRLTSPSSEEQDVTPRKSSLALRDQIAKAKAAKRATARQVSGTSHHEAEFPVIASGTFDFGLSDDPFGQNINQKGGKGLLRKRIDSARTDGRLNIAAMGFKQIPDEVMNMYSLEVIGAHDGSWAESVDLTRFVAADNELELIYDAVFPDSNPHEAADEDAQGNQFGGLETLDLHGNILIALPVGLRRLERLTSLNLSNNKLNNDCFHVISQVSSLRDLRIGGNELSGMLSSDIIKLQNLELLEIQRNGLTNLPDGFSELTRLRVLNLAENQFTSLPFGELRRLPLIELQAAKNKLAGVLIDSDVEELSHLQILDVTCNSLTSLSTSSYLQMPMLHQLSCSSNRLDSLPDMSSWTSLIKLFAEDNNLITIPEGFVSLPKIKNVDFGGNSIRILEEKIGMIDSLDIFRISGNLLREKKFAGMNTEDLKRALKSRIEPVDAEVDDGAFYSAPGSPTRASLTWPIKSGGVLDRSHTQSESLNPDTVADISSENVIKCLELHHNSFVEIPSAIAFFGATLTSLSVAHNQLSGDSFMKDDLELPALKELNLSSNTINSLQPLIQHLKAPGLEKLDISFNRLVTLPLLKPHFPCLISLLAANNAIEDLQPEAVEGLRVLDCSNNDIGSLNARIGLLGGSLHVLDVRGNRFRVPKYTILQKGTEATLAWLRDKIPANETTPEDID